MGFLKVGKALFVVNKNSRKGSNRAKTEKIIKKLANFFIDFEIYYSLSKEDLANFLLNKDGHFTSIIVLGGDGTFNSVINYCMHFQNKPILGLLPFGTLNDSARNMGLNSINKALKAIKNKKVLNYDLNLINNRFYFFYSLSSGLFSYLPIISKNKNKKIFGKFSYYFLAFKEFFKKNEVEGTLYVDNKIVDFKAPFVFFLNGSHMGGFKINKADSLFDAKISFLYSKDGIFHGLLNYFIFRKKLHIFTSDNFQISLRNQTYFVMDGEKLELSDFNIKVLPSAIKIYSL